MLSRMSESEIRRFTPFPVAGSEYERENMLRVSALKAPSTAHRKWADTVKNRNRRFCGRLVSIAKTFRQQVRQRNIPKLDSMDQALAASGSRPDSFLGSIFMRDVIAGRTTDESMQERIFHAVMQNPHLGRFFKAILCYVLSISRWWSDQKYNFDPSSDRDDWTDVTLPLYAADGDIIVSEDRFVRRTMTLIEPSRAVVVMTATEL